MTSTPIGAGLRSKLGLLAAARDQQKKPRKDYEFTGTSTSTATPTPKTPV